MSIRTLLIRKIETAQNDINRYKQYLKTDLNKSEKDFFTVGIENVSNNIKEWNRELQTLPQ